MPVSTAPSSDIASLLQSHLPDLIEFRRDLHMHPELSFQERRTAEVVAQALEAIGVKIKAGVADTGVIGYLPATEPGGEALESVALRADMDALPIEEATGLPYSSKTPGVMHACGHDGHTTILLGAARLLAQMPRPRPVTFLFQPAEEGGGGADRMCKQGALAGDEGGGIGNPVGSVYGLHGWPTIEVGRVASRPGPLLASVDDFVVDVKGVQAHGAYPHQGRDAILATAHIITAIQQIASRNVGPLESVVCSVGAINAGTANNIIPERVRFIGTVRTLTPEVKAAARKRFFEIVENTAKAFGCTAHIDWHDSYPVTHNDPRATARFFDLARDAFGPDRVDHVQNPTMGGEDFSYYGHHVPACFFLLGLKPKGAESFPTLHQPDFDFNDDALAVGIEMMVRLATGKA